MHAPTYSTPLLALDAVVLDTETTGLDARKARIVQVGAIRVRQGKILEETFDRLVHPGITIPADTIAVHGITNEMVAGAPKFADIAPALEEFCRQSVIVGHTVGYDIELLKREYTAAGRPWPGWRALDVRVLARAAVPSLADHSLDKLSAWLEIVNQSRHNALGDARATAEIFVKLLPLLRARNIRTLGEAEQASLALAETDARAAGGLMQVPDGTAALDVRAVSRIDSFPYRHRIREIMSAPPVIVAGSQTLGETISLLLDRKISSVLVKLASGEHGILTERDILRALDKGGPSAMSGPVEPYASRPLQTVAAEAFVYRAIGRIERLGLRHLGVRGGDGEVVGVVTTRNLLRNRSTTAIMLGDEIEAAEDAAHLAAAWSKVTPMARGLMEEAVDARITSAVISSEIRNMTRRAAQLAELRLEAEGLGKPPVPYAVLVLGSGGRGESQLAADQDNAIVYAEGGEGSPADLYLARLADVMCEILDAAGIPFCKGGVMAKNRAWRMSMADWRHRIDDWIGRQRPEDLLNVDIFFDAAPVHGDLAMGEAIWNYAFERGHRAVDFIKLLTENARRRGQPFTLLGNFRLDDKGRIDVKKFGLMPIFTSARVLAIRHDIRHRSTPERLQAAADRGIGSAEIIASIIEAQEVLIGTVLRQQLADLDAGLALTTFVSPARLDKAQRAQLKQALTIVDEAIGLVSEGRL